jgi:putative membrane protein
MTPEKVGALEDAALESLQASAEQSHSSFRAGVAQRHPSGFALKDGIGAGGISALAIEVNGQRFAYVNIDGNNMIRGFREEILDAVRVLGFDDGEVMTTDTHMVNGVVHARLGYHPIGEVGSRNALLNDVKETCREAMATLEPCDVGVITSQIPVTTLGSKSLRRVMNVVYGVSKWTIAALFLMVAALATVSLLFLV